MKRDWIYKWLDNPFIYEILQLIFSYGVIKQIRSIIRKETANQKYKKILDLGAGSGIFSNINSLYYGVDNNMNYLRKLKKRRKFCLSMDVTALGIRDNLFGCVLSVRLMHHLKDDDVMRLMREASRVCAQDGKLIIIDSILPISRLNLIAYTIRKMDRGKYLRKYKTILRLLKRACSCKSESYVFKSYPFFLEECVIKMEHPGAI